MATPAITPHGTKPPGHAHRFASPRRRLGLPCTRRDAAAAARDTPALLALDPLGQTPVPEDGGLVLADGGAILVSSAERDDAGGRRPPDEAQGAAAVQRWPSTAAGEPGYGPATARAAMLWGTPGDPVRAREIAARPLAVMQAHLAAGRASLAAGHPAVAGLACSSYVAHAPEGGVALDLHPAVRAWLGRVETPPGFEPMPRSPVPAAA